MIKNIIIGILLVIVGVLTLAGFETLQNFHKAQDYINALEKDFPEYIDITAETDAYINYYDNEK